MSIIRTEEALRAVIGEAPAGLQDKNIDHLDHFAVDFIAKCPFLILTTADANGRCDASPKGDAPGFVRVVDKKTLVIPDRPGNRLAYGHLNILSNAQVGLLFILPGTSETLRVNGTAELDASPELLRAPRGARKTSGSWDSSDGGRVFLSLRQSIHSLSTVAARHLAHRTSSRVFWRHVRGKKTTRSGNRASDRSKR